MFRRIMKSFALLMLCSGVTFWVESFNERMLERVVFAEETTNPEFYSRGGSEFETGTFQFNLKVGDEGQIRRPQNSPLKDFVYSFEMIVDDPSIISFDEQGNWVALKPGKTTVIPNFPTGDSKQVELFNEEMKLIPVHLKVDEVAVIWEVIVEPENAPEKPVDTSVAPSATPEKPVDTSVAPSATPKKPSDTSAEPADTSVGAVDISYVPMYRLYNPNNKEHFYTASKNERDTLVRIGWGKYEGVAWRAPKAGREVYRLYNPILKDHHYTMDQNEVMVLTTKHHWRNEGVAWYSAGSRPIYRLFHKGLTSGSHHYTMSENEVRVLQMRGWKYEGTAWYGEFEPVLE